jgi:hypothetical protein
MVVPDELECRVHADTFLQYLAATLHVSSGCGGIDVEFSIKIDRSFSKSKQVNDHRRATKRGSFRNGAMITGFRVAPQPDISSGHIHGAFLHKHADPFC